MSSGYGAPERTPPAAPPTPKLREPYPQLGGFTLPATPAAGAGGHRHLPQAAGPTDPTARSAGSRLPHGGPGGGGGRGRARQL